MREETPEVAYHGNVLKRLLRRLEGRFIDHRRMGLRSIILR